MRVLASTILSLALATSAIADTKLASRLTNAEQRYIIRGQTGAVPVCFINEMNFLRSNKLMSKVQVTFTDDPGIKFKYRDGFVRICGESEMVEIQPGHKPVRIQLDPMVDVSDEPGDCEDC